MLIGVANLHKIYHLGQVEVRALNGVDLQIKRGEYMAIMGPSGSGKSTLLHILGCLDTPTEGSYFLDDTEIHSLSEPELAEVRKKKIGCVFQNFNLLPRLTAAQNVELPMVYYGIKAKERQEKSLQLLEKVGLRTRSNHRPTELSGGECQRVAIARSLANDPSVILADEPTGNLDTHTGAEILAIFDALVTQGKTCIIVTHDPEIAKRTERIVKLRDGKVES